MLPDEIKQAPDNTTFTDNIIKEGNALPLLTLIPAIFAGISALKLIGQRDEVRRVRSPSPMGQKSPKPADINKQTEAKVGTLSDKDKLIERTMTDDELINQLNFSLVNDLVYQSKLYIVLSFTNSSFKYFCCF